MITVQLFFAALLIGPLLWGVFNLFKYKDVSVPKPHNWCYTMINSAVMYAIAFNLIFFLQELFLVLGKKALGLTAFLYHNNHTWEGEHPMVLLMQGSGAASIFLIGVICIVIYRLIINSQSNLKIVVLWLAFHGLIQSLPQVTIAYLAPHTDVGEALIAYLNLSKTTLIAMSITAVIAIVVICGWFSRQLLNIASEDVSLMKAKEKLKYIRFIAVGPALIGSILIVPFRIPPINQAITPFIVFAVSIPWVWSSAAVAKPIRNTSNRINEKIHWGPIVFFIVLLLFFQLVLAPGVKF
ncbi:hypothetical protein [Carboxylicivirga sp. RSCT41]|uniref:hypothetical protein n=1 Tax=Carboxylicivirga agarovorans TaxID=3417570 RepID=UPI003D32792A